VSRTRGSATARLGVGEGAAALVLGGAAALVLGRDRWCCCWGGSAGAGVGERSGGAGVEGAAALVLRCVGVWCA
jgi:hypothetical protein